MSQSWRAAFLERMGPAFGGSGGGGGSNTQTQTTQVQIPQYEQQYSQANQALAQSLGSQPYPLYQGQLVQGFSPQQNAGMQQASNASTAYQPDLGISEAWNQNVVNGNAAMGPLNYQMNPYGAQLMQGAAGGNVSLSGGQGYLNDAMNTSIPQQTLNYMNPYIQASLEPQIQNANRQGDLQQQQINAQATGANAFGDARQGVEQALQNYYTNQNVAGITAQGFNTGFNTAQQGALTEQAQQGQIGNMVGNLGLGIMQQQGQIGNNLANYDLGAANYGVQQRNSNLNIGQQDLTAAQQMAALGGQQQSLGITGANANYNAGQQQQTLGQQELNTAYQQYLNQVNWPFQMLNIQESALSNSPYSMQTAVSLPQANTTASAFGGMTAGLGSLASMFGGGSQANTAPFGSPANPG